MADVKARASLQLGPRGYLELYIGAIVEDGRRQGQGSEAEEEEDSDLHGGWGGNN